MRLISMAGMDELKEISGSFKTKNDFEKWIASELKKSNRGTWRKHDLAVALRVIRCSDNVKDTVERLENSTETHGVDWDMLGREGSIEEIENSNRVVTNSRDTNAPALPFGFLNSAWEAMKLKVGPEDRICDFSSSVQLWKKGAGQSGYCLVRGNRIIDIMVMMRS